MWLSLQAGEGEAHNLRALPAFGLRDPVPQHGAVLVPRSADLPPSLTAHRQSQSCSCTSGSSMLMPDTSPVHNPFTSQGSEFSLYAETLHIPKRKSIL